MEERQRMSVDSPVAQAERYYEEGFWRSQTLWSDVERVLRDRADHVAFETDERALTYGELDHAAGVLAERLAALGVGQGDVVAVLGRNSLEAPVVLVACMRAGAVLAPVPPMFSAAQLSALIAQCDARALVAFGGEREIEKCAGIPTEHHRFLALPEFGLEELLRAPA